MRENSVSSQSGYICTDCPRKCGIDRKNRAGACGAGDGIKIAKFMLHRFEEPVISGNCGSGAVFFSGCNLKCVFCQNRDISFGSSGNAVSEDEFVRGVLSLKQAGAHNIDLITAAPYVRLLAPILERIKPTLGIPIIYNSGGYESVETLKLLDGLIDVYLPDYKYYSSELSASLSSAPDYRETAEAAIAEMFRQVGKPVIDDGLIKRGVIVRHLVLPSCRKDSMNVLSRIAELFGGDVLVSVMRQYTPEFNLGPKFLSRKLTSFEYDSVIAHAAELHLKGFMQEKGCESPVYTPEF